VAWLPDRLPAKPNILWRTPLNEIALAGVVATGKVVLVADRELDDTVDAWRCLDAATGKSRWAVRYPAPGGLDYGNSPRAAPLIDGERVFLVGAQGHVHCVDLETGRLLWQRHARDEFGVTAEMPWRARCFAGRARSGHRQDFVDDAWQAGFLWLADRWRTRR
jgi:hypothetical protein